jgi:hypothetical protein
LRQWRTTKSCWALETPHCSIWRVEADRARCRDRICARTLVSNGTLRAGCGVPHGIRPRSARERGRARIWAIHSCRASVAEVSTLRWMQEIFVSTFEVSSTTTACKVGRPRRHSSPPSCTGLKRIASAKAPDPCTCNPRGIEGMPPHSPHC